MAGRTINGYYFADDRELFLARREEKAIEYLEKQVDFSSAQNVLALYRQAISQKLFSTQVGYDYLHSLQQWLVSSQEIPAEQIVPIPVISNGSSLQDEASLSNDSDEEQPSKPAAQNGENRTRGLRDLLLRERKKSRNLMIVLIVLIFMIAAMFFILLSSNLPTIVDYKEKLTDYYSSWDEELTEKEQSLNQREKNLKEEEQKASEMTSGENASGSQNFQTNNVY